MYAIFLGKSGQPKVNTKVDREVNKLRRCVSCINTMSRPENCV